MSLAIAESRRAFDKSEVPVGAIVVKGGIILGKGHNQTKSLADPTAHAEIIAITAACQTLGSERLDDCDIYSSLEPCPMCAGAIVLARIKRLFYAAVDPRMGACGSMIDIPRDGRMGHKVEIYRAGDEAEALRLLKEFYSARRNAISSVIAGCDL